MEMAPQNCRLLNVSRKSTENRNLNRREFFCRKHPCRQPNRNRDVISPKNHESHRNANRKSIFPLQGKITIFLGGRILWVPNNRCDFLNFSPASEYRYRGRRRTQRSDASTLIFKIRSCTVRWDPKIGTK